jgi:hypothetical protein
VILAGKAVRANALRRTLLNRLRIPGGTEACWLLPAAHTSRRVPAVV